MLGVWNAGLFHSAVLSCSFPVVAMVVSVARQCVCGGASIFWFLPDFSFSVSLTAILWWF